MHVNSLRLANPSSAPFLLKLTIRFVQSSISPNYSSDCSPFLLSPSSIWFKFSLNSFPTRYLADNILINFVYLSHRTIDNEPSLAQPILLLSLPPPR